MLSISWDAQSLINEMSESNDFPNITFTTDYEYTAKPTPITSPIISVTVKNCEIDTIGDTHRRTVSLTIGADIYAPFGWSSDRMYSMFENMVNFLLVSKSYSIAKVTCGDITYDKSCEALLVQSSFIFKTEELI